MTKKVLISLDELTELAESAYSLPDAEWMNPSEAIKQIQKECKEWFDATLKKQNGKIAVNVDGEPIVWGQNEESID